MCIIIWLQCKALFKFISWNETKKNQDEYFIQHKNINSFNIIIIEFVHRHFCVLKCFFLRHSFVSFVFLCLCHTAFEKLNYHILFLSVCCLLFIFFFSFTYKHFCRRHARSLLFVSDLDFVCADRAFFEHECLFVWFFFLFLYFFFFCVFLFFQDK